MSELQQSRYDQLLRRVGDLKGPGSKASEILTEVFPTFDVEGYQGELQALNRRVLGIGASTILGAAGELAKIQLFNPAGSGLLITVTSVTFSATTTQDMRYGGTHLHYRPGSPLKRRVICVEDCSRSQLERSSKRVRRALGPAMGSCPLF